MFDNLGYIEKGLVYEGLIKLIESDSGHGFHNNDKGHPAYLIGKKGEYDYEKWGDSPDHNQLYKMLNHLSNQLKNQDVELGVQRKYIMNWADFCNLACEIHDRK